MIKKIGKPELEIVGRWWEDYKGKFPLLTGVPEEILPEGYMYFEEAMPIMAIWVYNTPKIAWIAWTTANPGLHGTIRDIAYGQLMDHIETELKARGVLVVFAGVNNASLMSRFIKSDYKITDSDNVHMFKVLGG